MRVVDLFAGCGGLSLGFEKAGFEICGAFEYWTAAVKVYKLNFEHPIYQTDLSKPEAVDLISLLNPDIIIGGPPCQDFSSAGKRDEDGGRGDLSIAYANIIATVKPRYFVMENVELIRKSKKLVEVQQILSKANYHFFPVVLDASYCGAPQKRKRYILFGSQNLDANYLDSLIKQKLSTEPLTIRQYFYTEGEDLGVEFYYRHPRSYARRAVFSIDEPSPTIRGVNRPIPAGYPGHYGDAAPISNSIRPLTFYERCRIQTFPKDFKFIGTKSDCEQMIGNAVPVNLGRFVAEVLKSYIETMPLDSATKKDADARIELNGAVAGMLIPAQ